MDDGNFVLTEDSNGKIMAGGYIINSRLLTPSMSGGKKKDDINVPQYAIPAGLYYVDIPHKESSIETIYKKYEVLSDDIYDNLYNNAIFTKSSDESLNKNNNKKNTKRRRIKSNQNNKKSRKQK
jgi:hypothetical protein